MKLLPFIFLLLLPAIANADKYGIEKSVDTICFTWPDGRLECFDNPVDFEMATGIPFTQTVTVSAPSSTKWTVPVAKVEPVATTIVYPSKYSSPSNYHRHVLDDGTVIEHHDSNYGSASAHRGMSGRWAKYYGPLAPSNVVQRTIRRSVSRQQLVPVDCPTCPGGVRYEMRTVTIPASVAVAQKSNDLSYSRTVQRQGGWHPGRFLQRTRAAFRSRALFRPFSRSVFRSSGGS